MTRAFAVIAGGGTAGHTVPAIAIGQALVARGHGADSVHFVGSRRGVEAQMVPAAGFSITLLPGRGIRRSLSPANVASLLGLSAAAVGALWVVARRRPRVVVSVGGYAGLPAALAAVVWRRPLVLAESNAVPGAANRVVARFATSAAVAFEGTDLARSVVTGNPVRPEILSVERSAGARAEARRTLGLPEDRAVVAVFGGSLGSRRVNTAVRGLVERWAARSDVAVRHAVGRRDWSAYAAEDAEDAEVAEAEAEAEAGEAHRLVYQAVEYEDRMDLVYASADVVVCRAGGSSCAELTVMGLPALLVPLPGAPGDHQTANARALALGGAAVVIPDAELDGDRLAVELDALLTRPQALQAMAERSAALGRPDAADGVAALVEAAAG